MVFPATRQTFPEQSATTIADYNFINDMTDLLVALEDAVGLTTNAPGPGNHESRLKRLEGGGLPRFYFSAGQPTGTPLLNDIWINTSIEPWVQYYWTGTAWRVMGGDAIFFGSKQVDINFIPTNNQVPIYKADVDRIQWATILTNPLSNPGEIIISGVGGAPLPLAPGNDFDVLNINPTTHVPVWSPTPKFFDQLYLNEYMDIVLSSAPEVSASGELRLYASSSPLGLYYSINGGAYQTAGSGLTELSRLLNSKGSMLYTNDTLGTLAELGIGVEGSTIIAIGGVPEWRSNVFIPHPGTTQDWALIFYNGSAWVPLIPGTAGQFLKTQGATLPPIWGDLPASPTGGAITAPSGAVIGDVLIHDGTNWVPLHAGAAGRYLQTQGAGVLPLWATLPPTLSNPMTTPGDMIYATVGGNPARLAFGTTNNDKFMSVVAGIPALVDSPASLGKSLWIAG